MAGKDASPQGSNKPVRPDDPLDLGTSVAGEEDPGASIDLFDARDNSRQPQGQQQQAQQPLRPSAGRPDMAPGDQAPPGTPSTGEDVCPECGGSGRLGANACPNCLGSGKVIVGIGGA